MERGVPDLRSQVANGLLLGTALQLAEKACIDSDEVYKVYWEVYSAKHFSDNSLSEKGRVMWNDEHDGTQAIGAIDFLRDIRHDHLWVVRAALVHFSFDLTELEDVLLEGIRRTDDVSSIAEQLLIEASCTQSFDLSSDVSQLSAFLESSLTTHDVEYLSYRYALQLKLRIVKQLQHIVAHLSERHSEYLLKVMESLEQRREQPSQQQQGGNKYVDLLDVELSHSLDSLPEGGPCNRLDSDSLYEAAARVAALDAPPFDATQQFFGLLTDIRQHRALSSNRLGLSSEQPQAVMDPFNSPDSMDIAWEFHSLSLLDLARYCARSGLVDCLQSILQQVSTRMPALELLDILGTMPASIPPLLYSHLLPRHGLSPSASAISQISHIDIVDSPAVVQIIQRCKAASVVTESKRSDVKVFRILTHLISTPMSPDSASSDSFEADLLDASTAQWAVRRCLYLESVGFTMHAFQCASCVVAHLVDDVVSARGLQGWKAVTDGGFREEKDRVDTVSLLEELANQLYHFSAMLYGQLIPHDYSFIDWLCAGRMGQYDLVVGGRSEIEADNKPFSEVLVSFFRPMFEGDRRLFQTLSLKDLLFGLSSEGAFDLSISRSYQEQCCLYAAANGAKMVSDSMQVGWCDWLVDAVSLSVVPGDISSLQRAADVANASNPTLPLDSRLLLLWSDSFLVQLVVRACLAYDDIQSGRDVMWHLVECTPVRANVSITSDGSSVGLDSWYRKLDAIELALTASEVLKSYVHSPPLSSLTKSDDLKDTRTMKYKERLLQDCELLVDRLELLYGLGTCAASSLTLSQALILKICSAFIRKDRSDPRVWEQLLTDVLELDSVEFFRSTSTAAHSIMSWIGVLILHCFVHSCSSESTDCKYYTAAVQDILNRDPQQDNLEPLSSTLINEFHVSSDLCQRIILNECRCVFDSMDGFLSERSEFNTYGYLLSLIPDSSGSTMMDVNSEVYCEKCVLKVAGLVHHIGQDIQPSSLRCSLNESPEKFIFTLLTEQPFAYYTLLDDLSIDYGPGSPDSRSYGTSSNSINSNSASRDRLSPAVDLAMLLINASNRRYSEIERSAQMVKIFVHLTRTAMTVGDLEGAADYCGLILREQSYSTLDIEQQQAVVDLVSAVVRSLQETKAAESSLDRTELGKMSELRLLMMKNSNEELLMGLLSPSPIAVPTVDACDSFQQGKSLLYRIVALMLHGEDSHPTDLSAVSGDSSINDLLDLSAIPLLKQELVCAFMVQEDYSSIAALLDSIVRDLRKKLSKVASLTISGSDSDCSVLRLDETMVDKLVGKGFSRNGAKRSIISTRGVSLEAALSWAIEHSLDRDFENPIAQTVKGALLSNESGSESSSLTIAQNIKQIIRFIEDLDYECRLMMHGVAESLPSESRVNSKNNAGHSALRRKQSMGARRLSNSESITFDADADVIESSRPTEQHVIESSRPTEQHVIESSRPTEQHVIESSHPTEQHVIESSHPTEQHVIESSRPTEQHVIKSSRPTELHVIKSIHPLQSVTESRSSMIYSVTQVLGEFKSTTVGPNEKLEDIALHVNPFQAEGAIELILITNDEGNLNTGDNILVVDSAEKILRDPADEFVNNDANEVRDIELNNDVNEVRDIELNNDVNEVRDIKLSSATTDQSHEAPLSPTNVVSVSTDHTTNVVSVSTDHTTNIGVSGWSDFDIEFDDDVAQELSCSDPLSSALTIESHLRSMFEVAEEEIWFNLNRAATYISCFGSYAHGTQSDAVDDDRTQPDVVDDDVQDSCESFSVVMQQILRLCCLLAESTVNPQQGLSAVLEMLESVTDAEFHIWFARQMDERVFTSIVYFEDCSSSLLKKCIYPSKQFSCWLMVATNFKATYAQKKEKVNTIENHEDIFSRDPLR